MKKESDSKKESEKEETSGNKKQEDKKEGKKSEEKQEEELIKEIKEAEEERDNEQFFDEPVRTIPFSAESGAPVLERIIQRESPQPDFQIQEEEKDQRRINYSPTSNSPNYGFQKNSNDEPEEKKYESNFVPPVLSRRETFGREMRQEFLRPQNETWNNQAKEWHPEQIDLIERDAGIPFEEKKKYKRFRTI